MVVAIVPSPVRLTLSLDIFDYKPRAAIRLEVPKVGSRDQTVVVTPSVISAKWTLNNHLQADELTVTMGWEECGVDPRLLKNATCEFYMWDDVRQDQFDMNDREKSKQYLRFAGVATKAARKLGDSVSEVTITFHDYTTLFIHMKPFPTAGMPLYTDTLKDIWTKICDHTGARNPDFDAANKKSTATNIISSVKALRDRLNTDFLLADQEEFTLGKLVNKRFHAIDKPSPHQGANAWEVWQWCVGSLGLVSYIQGTECIVMRTTEHYRTDKAPAMIYGENILEFEESADTSISGKGIMLKSFNTLTRQTIEAVYPKPGDERLKLKKAEAKRALKAGRAADDVDINAVSGDYEEFAFPWIQDQAALDIRAEQAYEEFSRQSMEGTLKTSEMAIEAADGSAFDILNIKANDPLIIRIDPDIRQFASNADQAKKYLVDVLGYNDGLASIISQNFGSSELQSPIFHVTSMAVELNPDEFNVEIKYHNLVNIKGLS